MATGERPILRQTCAGRPEDSRRRPCTSSIPARAVRNHPPAWGPASPQRKACTPNVSCTASLSACPPNWSSHVVISIAVSPKGRLEKKGSASDRACHACTGPCPMSARPSITASSATLGGAVSSALTSCTVKRPSLLVLIRSASCAASVALAMPETGLACIRHAIRPCDSAGAVKAATVVAAAPSVAVFRNDRLSMGAVFCCGRGREWVDTL